MADTVLAIDETGFSAGKISNCQIGVFARFPVAEYTPGTHGRRMAAELDQARLLRVECERAGGEPSCQRLAKTEGVRLVLKADDDVVGVPHDD